MDFPRSAIETSLPARFRAVVERCADRPALRCDGLEWTYRELDRCANLVARRLPPPCAGSAPVLLLLGHGALELIALLAVLKSGHAWVALDPANPQARLAAIAADVAAACMLTSRPFASRAEGLAEEVIELPAAATLLAAARDPDLTMAADRDPGLDPQPGALASVVYTSGSTGMPKGVMRSHRCSLHRCWLFRCDSDVAPGDRIAHMFSCSFVAAEVDVYGALLNGATLCCYPVRERGFAPLPAWLAAERVSLLHPPPAWWRAFLQDVGAPPELPALRRVFLSGEALFRRDIERMRSLLPQCSIEHRLSSSEASVMAVCRIDAHTPIDDEVVPVGYPVRDKDVRLLDAEGREVAPGEVGEIVVQSRYLSPGYWRQPELTASRFLPVAGDPALRRFHTGDFGRLAPDGRLFHLGRQDEQLKIRGYRVEPREVEAALQRLDGVRSAVVVPNADAAGEVALHAFVVLSPGQGSDAGVLRHGLGRVLPDYMIPAQFGVLDALPLTPNGKVDRMALIRCGAGEPRATGPAPRDGSEEAIARVWCEVLDLPRVGRDDDFFALGGNSLRAARVVARLAGVGQQVSLSRLYATPTVAGLAALIDGNRCLDTVQDARSVQDVASGIARSG